MENCSLFFEKSYQDLFFSANDVTHSNVIHSVGVTNSTHWDRSAFATLMLIITQCKHLPTSLYMWSEPQIKMFEMHIIINCFSILPPLYFS